jgi:hypothetical protein
VSFPYFKAQLDTNEFARRWDAMAAEMNSVVDWVAEMFGVHCSLLVTGPNPNRGGAIVTWQ